MPTELLCEERADETTRNLVCIMPDGGRVQDFMIVGKKAWIARENLIIDCQHELEIRLNTQ